MAGDWIKLEKATIDKPEIAMLARKLSISHAEAFVSVVRVFAWADTNVASEDGFVPFLSASEADRLSHAHPGTCEALASGDIKWLSFERGGFMFANWDRHNGKSAKRRALDKETKRNQRDLSTKCPDAKRTKDGLEKRREEKKEEREEVSPKPQTIPESISPTQQAVIDSFTFRCGPTQQFEEFYQACSAQMRSGKPAAVRVFDATLAAIQQEHGLCPEEAFEHLMVGTRAYAASWRGKSKFAWSACKFLTDGHYDDDRNSWEEGDNGYGTTRVRPLSDYEMKPHGVIALRKDIRN